MYRHSFFLICLVLFLLPLSVIGWGVATISIPFTIANAVKSRDIKNRKEKLIRLSWVYPDDTQLIGFTIYRSEAAEPVTTYKIIAKEKVKSGAFSARASKYEFQDQKIKMNTEYQYRIMANFMQGGYSPLTKSVKLKY